MKIRGAESSDEKKIIWKWCHKDIVHLIAGTVDDLKGWGCGKQLRYKLDMEKVAKFKILRNSLMDTISEKQRDESKF